MQTTLDRAINKLVFRLPELGCVLYLPGLPSGGSKIYDRSPYGNHGAITGATWKRLPSGLCYLDFDGSDDKVDCGSDDSLDITDAITFKVWIRIDGGSGTHRFFMHKAKTPADNYKAYSISVASNNKLRPHLYISGALKTFDSTLTPSTDTWYQVIVTFDGSIIYLFINGAYDNELAAAGTIGTTTDPLYIGSRAADLRFNGGIALPEISNLFWSRLDIQNSFDREKHLFGVW